MAYVNSLITLLQETQCLLLAESWRVYSFYCSDFAILWVILQITNFNATISKQNEVATFFQLINQQI